MAYSQNHSLKFAGIALAFFLWSIAAGAQVLRGNVTNGTTKKPAAGDDVILIKIDRGMNEEARTKTNSRGEFSFDLPDNQSMRAVRVEHQKASYYQPVVPGSTSVAVTVYDVAQTVPGIHRTDQSLILQAQGGSLEVYEIFEIRNESQPPRTQPSFSFYLPDGATVEGGSAMRERGMPLKSAPVAQEEKGKYLFMYPVIPGVTHFEAVYKLPYSGSLKFEPKLAGPVDKFFVVTPKSMEFRPEGSSQYQQMADSTIDVGAKNVDVHESSGTPATVPLAFNISGEGVLQQDASGDNQGPGGGLGVPNERPNPLSHGQWAFLGVLIAFLAGGGVWVYVNERSGLAAVATPQNQPAILDALKEEMFQLEADRAQGKVNQQEYQSAKNALDKTLKRAMGKKQ